MGVSCFSSAATEGVLIYSTATYLSANQIPPNLLMNAVLSSRFRFPLERQILQELLHRQSILICWLTAEWLFSVFHRASVSHIGWWLRV